MISIISYRLADQQQLVQWATINGVEDVLPKLEQYGVFSMNGLQKISEEQLQKLESGLNTVQQTAIEGKDLDNVLISLELLDTARKQTANNHNGNDNNSQQDEAEEPLINRKLKRSNTSNSAPSKKRKIGEGQSYSIDSEIVRCFWKRV